MSTAIQTPPTTKSEKTELPADAGRRLNYRHLAAAHAVARAGGLTRAAQALGLAPPTLSAQIRDFEKTLGVKLFERVRGGLKPTEAGGVAIAYAERIFATGCDLLEALEPYALPEAETRVVGVAPQIPASLAAHWVDEMVDREPDARVVLSEVDAVGGERALAKGEVDVLLTTKDSAVADDDERVASESLGGCGLGFFARSDVAAELSADFPKCLDEAPHLGTSEDAPIDAWLRGRGIRRQVVAVADSLEVRRNLAAEGRGIFAAPAVMSHSLCASGELRWLGTAHEVRTHFAAVSDAGRYGAESLAQVASGTRRRVLKSDDHADDEAIRRGVPHATPAPVPEVSS